MKLVLVGALTLALSSGVLPAIAQSQARACAAIDTDAERLACYDGVYRTGEGVSDALSASFESEQLIPARPSGRDRARMTVSCEAGTLSVGFSFANQLVSATGDFGALTTQLDAQPARTRSLDASPDNLSLGLWTTRDAAVFLDSLVGSSNLTVRMTPANYRSLSVRFSLADVAEGIAPVRAACE